MQQTRTVELGTGLFALLGMGVDDLSANPARLPVVKAVIRATSRARAQRVLAEALTLESGAEIRRLLRDELPPKSRIEWVRLISIVVAGAGAIIGILGLVAEFSFAPGTGQHAALLGSASFFGGFLVALISLTIELNQKTRNQ